MTNQFEREERYIVFKISDLGNSLKGDDIRNLARGYAEQRQLRGKPPLNVVVVEQDWPEFEPTWKAIEARMTGRAIEAEVRAEAHKPLGPATAEDQKIYDAMTANYSGQTSTPTAKQCFDKLMGDEKESPIERLRFFCSLAMAGQDWLDVEPFFEALAAQAGQEPVAKFLVLACTDDGTVIPKFCKSEGDVFAHVLSEMFSEPSEASDEGAEHAEYVARELLDEGKVDFEGGPGLLLYRLPEGFINYAAPVACPAPLDESHYCPDCESLQARIEQFDRAITRIGHHVGAVCAGVDTEDEHGPGGHTAVAIIEKFDALQDEFAAAQGERNAK